MKLANAFLASLLFFGVTPLVIDKQRDENALTTTSTPSDTTSPIALVASIDASFGYTTDNTHDALEARAGMSRGSRRRKTADSPSIEIKTTEKITTIKGDPKPKPKPTPKTKPKGKADTTCTVEQKKAGKCLSQNKNKNWEVLHPTKGCRPKNCKKCGKATDAKGGKKSGKKTTRDISSLRSTTFYKRTATSEPASKTEAGLMAWTKDVWASSPKVLHLPEDGYQPTSFFVKWTSLGQGTKFVTVKNLMGCTSVVAVSDLGVYMSHHWQHTVGDQSFDNMPPQFENAFTNPMTGKGRASFKLTAAQKKKAVLYQPEAVVKSDVDDVFPTTGFEALTNVRSSFTAASNVQSMVAVWDGKTGNGDKFVKTGPFMKDFVDDLLPGTATKLVRYGNTEDALNTSRDDNDYHGKIIVSYDSGTKKYQVWMAGAKLDGPILKN
ncbi:hypothetical protein C7974DRAFT_472508 [Boeremia exigua]|uniref:uncharacterized protein n=1 Tax=Boeremia exigua TaxID=749465 RepID=UPI001E8E2D50|nr:uncharacterized protein C7974DRAFT_472508 [Boeremia exigua]KAH6629809.1 hypothetical protein C7974DRAFT_472508 [Boeremia exigua]